MASQCQVSEAVKGQRELSSSEPSGGLPNAAANYAVVTAASTVANDNLV